MKDVLFMTQYTYPEYISSAVLPFETAQKLANDGYDVGILSGYPYEYSEKKSVKFTETVGKVRIHRIKYLGAKRRGTVGRVTNFVSFFISMIFNIRIIKDYKCVVLYSDPPILPLLSVIIKKKYKVKIIFICYDIYPEIGVKSNKINQNGIVDKVFRWVNYKTYKTVDKVVVLSEDMRDFIKANRNIASDKITVIRNWGNDRGIGDVKSSNIIDIPENAYVISYLGNLGVCQDADTIISVIKDFKDNKLVHFIIAGHGSKMIDIKSTIDNYKLSNVHYFPFLHGSDYDNALDRSNAFILSLVKEMTGLCSPSKVCNYLDNGKPIFFIGDETMEIAKDIEAYKCGYIVNNGDSLKLISCIKKNLDNYMNQDSYSYKTMCKQSHLLYEDKYSKKVCLQQYSEMIKYMLK